ncbi:MAG: TIGR02757 family protein [Proteobacteria bacterium]|nr:TIGR02757 family protein [Pseudomonadota bacterium]
MKQRLEDLYSTYNRRCYVHPDPLEYVYHFEARSDREIAGLIASAFAFGRVSQILLTLERVFTIMGPSPSTYLEHASRKSLSKDFNGFVYRFVRDRHVVDLLMGIKDLVADFGSLENSFVYKLSHDDETVVPSMCFFVKQLLKNHRDPGYLLALPEKGSACKRMNLFLRWMVRKDDVDTGAWTCLLPERLIIPLDTHMHKISRNLGLTTRNQADMKTALDITQAFGHINPADPVKYDFALTRFGIRDDLDLSRIPGFFKGGR